MSQATPQSAKPIPQMDIPEDLEPMYVNVVRITHSPSEMVFDFARILPGMTPSKVVSRLLMSPLSAKLFHKA